MRILRTGQLLLAAALAVGCNKDNDHAVEHRVDVAKAEAKDLKDRAEKRTEQAKDELDHKLDATKAAADQHVEDVKAAVDRKDVRGRDEAPDATRWRTSWDRFSSSPTGRWNDDDEWVVVRGNDGEIRAHRRVEEQPADKMSDGDVTTAVKGRFATNDDIRPLKLDVDTKDGMVSLKGDVPSRGVAGEAMRIALGTKGVRQVVSHLKFR